MLTLVLVQTLCFFAFHRSFAVKTEKSCDSVTPRAQDCKFGLETLYVFIRKQIAIICHVQQMTPPASARRAISQASPCLRGTCIFSRSFWSTSNILRLIDYYKKVMDMTHLIN